MVTRRMIDWINNNLPIEVYLEELGVEIPPNGKVFCPFHHNVNTPSAKVYLSEQSGNGGRLHCYAEGRSYTTFNVIKAVGYSDHQIHNMVPKEHWYGIDEQKPLDKMTIPILDLNCRDDIKGGIFELLAQLDYMWENKDTFRSRTL